MRKIFFGLMAAVLATGMMQATAFASTPFNRKYSDIQEIIKQGAAKYPHVARSFDIGLNDTGQMIQGLAIGTGPVRTLIVATHHGNEYGSTEVALAMMKSLVEAPIQGQTVFVIPVLNVSGYDKRTREELGRDPNRDYPGPCGTDGPFKLRSTKALAEFIDKAGIVTSATLHTYAPAVLYPWGFSTQDIKTEYDDLYVNLGKAAAHESGYKVGNSGAALYPADGCYEDYAMWKEGIWSLLFELGLSHSPDQKAIDDMIRVNVPGLRRFLAQAPAQRAEKHAFTGKCDTRIKSMSRSRRRPE